MCTSDPAKRIDQLEVLFSEQQYTIETLNTVVCKQTQDIERLSMQIELLKHQIRELKSQLPEATIVDEKPPHY